MKVISDQLKEITEALGFVYIRSATIEESNILTHYTPSSQGVAIYTGFGDSANTFSGAAPIQVVPVSVWCLVKKGKIDQLAEATDIQLEPMHQLGSDIVNRFAGVESVTEFTLEAVYNKFDDLFIGYNLLFDAEIRGDECSD